MFLPGGFEHVANSIAKNSKIYRNIGLLEIRWCGYDGTFLILTEMKCVRTIQHLGLDFVLWQEKK